MDWMFASPSQSHMVKAYPPMGWYLEVIRVRWGHENGAPTMGLMDEYCQKKKERLELTLSPPCEDRERKAAVCKPGRVLTRTWSSQHLTSYFQLPELWEINLLRRPPSLWHFIMATRADQNNHVVLCNLIVLPSAVGGFFCSFQNNV